MQGEVICTECSLPYVACTDCGTQSVGDLAHCYNCGSVPKNEVISGTFTERPYSRNEVISGASMGAPTRKGNSMLSSLIDARDEIQQSISELNDRIDEINNAISELDDAEEKISELIDTLENVDGLSVSVEIDSFSVDVSVNL